MGRWWVWGGGRWGDGVLGDGVLMGMGRWGCEGCGVMGGWGDGVMGQWVMGL